MTTRDKICQCHGVNLNYVCPERLTNSHWRCRQQGHRQGRHLLIVVAMLLNLKLTQHIFPLFLLMVSLANSWVYCLLNISLAFR